MISHDSSNVILWVFINFDEHVFLAIFAPPKQFVILLFKLIVNFDRSPQPAFLH